MVRARVTDASGSATTPRPPNGLTRSDRQILRKLADGLSDLQIAAALLLDEAAVKNHVRRILIKLNITRAQAAAYATQHPFDAAIADLPSPKRLVRVAVEAG